MALQNPSHGQQMLQTGPESEAGVSSTESPLIVQPDFIVENHGTICLLRPRNKQAVAWVEKHIGGNNGFQPYWPTVVVEPRCLAPILDRIADAGLAVRR